MRIILSKIPLKFLVLLFLSLTFSVSVSFGILLSQVNQDIRSRAMLDPGTGSIESGTINYDTRLGRIGEGRTGINTGGTTAEPAPEQRPPFSCCRPQLRPSVSTHTISRGREEPAEAPNLESARRGALRRGEKLQRNECLSHADKLPQPPLPPPPSVPSTRMISFISTTTGASSLLATPTA